MYSFLLYPLMCFYCLLHTSIPLKTKPYILSNDFIFNLIHNKIFLFIMLSCRLFSFYHLASVSYNIARIIVVMTLRFERYFSIVFFLVLEVFFYHKSYLKCYSISSTSLDPLFYIFIHLPVMYAIRYYYLYISCLWILPLHWSSTLKEITEENFSQAYIKMDRW